MTRGKLIVVSGFSGAGKGTVMNELINRYDNYRLSVSATTRKPRPGEAEGVSYFFKSVEEFEKMIEDNRLVEYAKYVDNYYGTPKSFVEENLNAGMDVILEIEIQGAMKVKEQYPDAILMFITPPCAKELRNRLVNRGTETEEVIEKRMKQAALEAKGVEKYDYIVVNDNLSECVETVDNIVKSEHNRTSDRISIIEGIRAELEK